MNYTIAIDESGLVIYNVKNNTVLYVLDRVNPEYYLRFAIKANRMGLIQVQYLARRICEKILCKSFCSQNAQLANTGGCLH